ncbi:MAG: FHA domain-containing protein [Coprococcus eutactus]
MNREKITVVPMGDTYKVNYCLDVDDVVDAKVYDMSRSGQFPQMILCNMQENGGVRVFEYDIDHMKPLPEILRSTVGKKEMLTVIYNVLDGLESFGKGMVSLSFVAKDIQHIFVSPETYDVGFIVAPVNKEATDMNEVRNLIKTIIVDATYSENDGDNYVARLINLTNVPGTFSSSDMKNKVIDLFVEMGASVPVAGRKKVADDAFATSGNSHILRSDVPSPKVSRLGVMRNNARMNGGMPPMGPNGMPVNGGMPPMGPNGMPVNGGMPPMGSNGMPMNGGMPPMGPNGMPMNGGMPPMGPNGMPINGGVPPMGPNGMPVNGGMPPMGPNGMPMNGGVPPMGPNGMPMNGGVPPMGPNGMPMNGGMPPMGPNGMPMNENVPPMSNPLGGAPVPPMGNPFETMPEVKDAEKEDVEENKGAEEDREIQEQPKMEKPFGEATIPSMPEMSNPFGGAPVPPTGNLSGGVPVSPMENPIEQAPEDRAAEDKENENTEETSEQPVTDNLIGGAPVPPMPEMGNPFSGAPIPEMGNPFGGAPMPPMPEMNNQFGGTPVSSAVPTGMPFEEGPAPYFIRMRTGERINIDKAEFKIGRKASEVDYAISDNTDISRVHCVIVKDRGVCFISDNNSTNGTYINGQRLNEGEKRFLTNGVVVLLGNEEFVYHIR